MRTVDVSVILDVPRAVTSACRNVSSGFPKVTPEESDGSSTPHENRPVSDILGRNKSPSSTRFHTPGVGIPPSRLDSYPGSHGLFLTFLRKSVNSCSNPVPTLLFTVPTPRGPYPLVYRPIEVSWAGRHIYTTVLTQGGI